MSYGMTYEDFWDGDIYKACVYREYHEICAARENQLAWLHGLYTYKAVASALEGAFWNKKGRKPEGYFDHPIPMTEREIEEEKERKKQRTLDWVRKGQQ